MDIVLIGNILYTVMNMYWTWQNKKIQNDREVIRALQMQLHLKEEAVQDMLESKNQMKSQYHRMLIEHKKLQAEFDTHNKIHSYT